MQDAKHYMDCRVSHMKVKTNAVCIKLTFHLMVFGWVKGKWYRSTPVIYVSVEIYKVGAGLCITIDPDSWSGKLPYIIKQTSLFSTFLSVCEAALSTALIFAFNTRPDTSHSSFLSHGFITRLTCSCVLHSHRKGNRKMPAGHREAKTHMRWKTVLKGAILLVLSTETLIINRERDMRQLLYSSLDGRTCNGLVCPSLKWLGFENCLRGFLSAVL